MTSKLFNVSFLFILYGLSSNVLAAPVSIGSLTIEDVDGDGKSGLLTFGPTSDIESIGFQFSGDTGIDMLWQGVNQGSSVFTTGFSIAGEPVLLTTDMSATPGTNNGAVGTMDDVTGDILSVISMDFGIMNFYLAPDPGTLQIFNLGNGRAKLRWSHVMNQPNTTFGPQLQWFGLTSSIQLEGTFHAAVVPVPAAVWLFGSGLLSLGLLGRRKISQ